MSVILNPAEGWAQIGHLQVSIRLTGHNGAVQINGDLGPCLSPVSFMERSRIASYATVSKNPVQALAKLVVETSLQDLKQNTSEADPVVVAIIALVLAGANETTTLSFSESALLVSQQSGWTPELLGQSNAADIDKLAQQLVPEIDDGWVRLKFNTPDETDLNLIQNELANNLLRRLESNHDVVHSATPVVKSSANCISDTSPLLFQLSDQPAHIANNTSRLKDEYTPQKLESSDNSTPAIVTAGMRIGGGDRVSSSPGDINSKYIPTSAASLSDKDTESANNMTRSVTDGKIKIPPLNEKLLEKQKTQFLQNRQSIADQLASIAKASATQPVSVNKNQSIASRENSPNVATVKSVPERLISNPLSSLLDTSYEYTQDNKTGKFAQPGNRLTENIPLQTQILPKTSTQKEITVELDDLLEEFATRLHLEADLRGLDR